MPGQLPTPPRARKDRFQAGLGGPPWAQPAGAASALLLWAGLVLGGSVQPTGWQYHRDPGNVGTRATLALVCGGQTFPEVGKGEGEERGRSGTFCIRGFLCPDADSEAMQNPQAAESRWTSWLAPLCASPRSGPWALALRSQPWHSLSPCFPEPPYPPGPPSLSWIDPGTECGHDQADISGPAPGQRGEHRCGTAGVAGGGRRKAPGFPQSQEARGGSSSPERGLASGSTWEFEFPFLKVCLVRLSLWSQNTSWAQGAAESQDLAPWCHCHQGGAHLRALGW